MRIDEFVSYIVKRHRIYLNRQSGMPKPWTEDPILQSYRFCNAYRELDTVTQWIRKNWREPNYHEPDVWFAMVVARLTNWPDTLAEMGAPATNWHPLWFIDAVNSRMDAGKKAFTGAYMIHAGPNEGSKASYLAHEVLTPMWERREELRPRAGDTLEAFHTRLMTCKDMGSFMAGQVVADTKYTAKLDLALDWFSWAASGPGSKRGLNRVCDNDDIQAPWKEWQWLQVLQEVQEEVNHVLPKGWERMNAQDVQNNLCEFDKYERVRLGEGKPRSKYPGGA